MSLDGIDEWDESFLQEAMRIELEAVASRNLLTAASYTPPAPQPPPIPLPSPPPQPMEIVRFDRGSDAASGMGIAEVPFSPPRELSQRHGVGRPRAGDGFEMVDSWGDFGSTDAVRKNNRELERLKRELTRVSMLLNHKESECSELQRDRAMKEEQLKYASEQIEAKEAEIYNLKRANIEHSTRPSSMNEGMLNGTERDPVPVRIPLSNIISTGGLKERKIAHVPSNREDPMMASTPAVLELGHQIMNDSTLSISKSIGIQTEYLQNGDINNNCSKTAKSLYEEPMCINLWAIWDNEPAHGKMRSELASAILPSCSEDIFAPFDDMKMSEASTNELSLLQAQLMKVHDQTAGVRHVVEELLSLCRVTNASLLARSLKILRAILHHLISSESFSNPRENVSAELSPTVIKQGKRRKNENSHLTDLCLFNEDSSFDKITDLPSMWWVTIFDTAREAITKSSKESFVSDALWIMILVVMRSDVNTEREKFGLVPVIECVHLLLKKDSESGPPPPTTTTMTTKTKPLFLNSESKPFVKKQAIYLLFLILNCPKTLALFCSGGQDGMDVISERTEGQSEDVLQHQISLLLGDLGECLSCPLSGSMELKLLRQVIVLLAYIASYGKSGFELLLVPVVPAGLNLLELIVQVISAQMTLESGKERNLVMREALILLNRLASNPIYSKTTLEVLTRSKSCASLTMDIAIWIPRMGRGGPHTDNTHMELEIANLASVFSSRLFSFVGER